MSAASQLPHFAIPLHNLGNSSAAAKTFGQGRGNAIRISRSSDRPSPGWTCAGSTPYKGMELMSSYFGGTRRALAVRWRRRSRSFKYNLFILQGTRIPATEKLPAGRVKVDVETVYVVEQPAGKSHSQPDCDGLAGTTHRWRQRAPPSLAAKRLH